eukprot:14840496-Alexandrium_andersonii.AAC.1
MFGRRSVFLRSCWRFRTAPERAKSNCQAPPKTHPRKCPATPEAAASWGPVAVVCRRGCRGWCSALGGSPAAAGPLDPVLALAAGLPA